MPDFDPVDRLSSISDAPTHPDEKFSAELLENLLNQLEEPEKDGGSTTAVIPLDPGTDSTKGRWIFGVAAAIALVAVVTIGILLRGGTDDRDIITDTPPSPTSSVIVTTSELQESPEVGAPAAEEADDPGGSGVSLETARELLEAVGGTDGLEVASRELEHPWNAVSFDPLDPDRFITAELRFTANAPPRLFSYGGGELLEVPIPWADEQSSTRGGVFQRDGSILMDPGFTGTIWPVLDSAGELRAQVQSGRFPTILTAAEGTRTISIAAETDRCPYLSVNIGDPDGVTEVATGLNEFSRVAIVEPNVGVAFPFFPDAEGCEETTSTVAMAWNLETGERLTDHPLDGQEVARAAMSADGSRILTIDRDGAVRVISADSGEVIADLNESASAAHTLVPVALNDSGTIAAVAEDDGTLSVWHVDSGELLLTLDSAIRTLSDSADIDSGETDQWEGLLYRSAASLSHDASRVAILDQSSSELGVLRVVTLDPNDWLEMACAAGYSIDVDERRAQGLDDSLDC